MNARLRNLEAALRKFYSSCERTGDPATSHFHTVVRDRLIAEMAATLVAALKEGE